MVLSVLKLELMAQCVISHVLVAGGGHFENGRKYVVYPYNNMLMESHLAVGGGVRNKKKCYQAVLGGGGAL